MEGEEELLKSRHSVKSLCGFTQCAQRALQHHNLGFHLFFIRFFSVSVCHALLL